MARANLQPSRSRLSLLLPPRCKLLPTTESLYSTGTSPSLSRTVSLGSVLYRTFGCSLRLPTWLPHRTKLGATAIRDCATVPACDFLDCSHCSVQKMRQRHCFEFQFN